MLPNTASPPASSLRPPLYQVTVYLDVDAPVWPHARSREVLRHGARSSSRALVKKKEERAAEKTCERCEDFSHRQLLYLLCFFDPVHSQPAVKGITSKGALLHLTVFSGF